MRYRPDRSAVSWFERDVGYHFLKLLHPGLIVTLTYQRVCAVSNTSTLSASQARFGNTEFMLIVSGLNQYSDDYEPTNQQTITLDVSSYDVFLAGRRRALREHNPKTLQVNHELTGN